MSEYQGGEARGYVAAIILYTDKTSVTRDLSQQSWPIIMSLANIHRTKRGQRGSYVYMGTMPLAITNRFYPGYIDDNNVKLQIFHECMNLVVQSLKAVAQR